MRRVLLPLLVLAAVPFASAASAGCDPETGQCYAVDCLAWDPRPPTADEAVADVLNGHPERLATWVLPPVCPT